jgi:hypothetical protein
MNHQTTETKLEFALREQERERVEKEKARYHLSRVLADLNFLYENGLFYPEKSRAQIEAEEYLNPPVVKKPYANDEEGRI